MKQIAPKQMSAEGLALVKAFEGFSATVYRCPGGWLTVGYGHVVRDVARFAHPIGLAEAEALLQTDIAQSVAAVARLITAPLAPRQFDALVSFTFNLGAGKLQASRLRQVINRGDMAAAPAEFGRWVYAAGRILPGLVRRRAAEARLFAQG